MNTWKMRGLSMLLTGSMLVSVLGAQALAADGKAAAEKEETVFVVAGADGTAREIIVSDWLKNGSGAGQLRDSSDLQDIQVVKGDAEMSGSGSKISWETGGEDVYYQGTSTKTLPVSVEFSYELDGKKVTPEELAGQSGALKITVQYHNNTRETVKVDGKRETMAVPFLMVTGLLLDSKCCKNISVDHGAVETDGDRTIILGYGLPGLSDSLKLDELAGEDREAPELPDSVEITADVTDFDLEMAVTVASCGLLSKLELSGDETREELEDALDELKDATEQLMDGTEDLLDGTKSLKDGTEELLDGTKSLKDGTSSLKSGTGELLSGAGSLDDGVGTLQSGGGTLQSGAGSLDDGAGSLQAGAQSLHSGISQIQQALTALDAQSQTLTDGSAAVKQALQQIQSGLQGVSTSTDALDALTAGSGEIQKGLTTLRESAAALQQGVSYGAYQQLLQQQGIDLDALQAGNSKAIEGLDQVLAVLDSQIQALEAAAAAKNPAGSAGSQAASSGAKGNAASAGSESVTMEEPEEVPEEPEVIDETPADEMEDSAVDTAESAEEASDAQQDMVMDTPAESETADMPEAEATRNAGTGYRLQMLDDGQSALGQLKAAREQLGQIRGLLGSNNQAIAGTNAVAEAYLTGVNYNLSQLLGGAKTLETEYGKLHSGILTLAGTLSGLSQSMGQLSAGIDQLVTEYTALDDGTRAYTGAVGEILAGQQKLEAGAGTLVQGTDTLRAGTQQLYTGAGTLVAGLDTLRQGTGSLKSGAAQLDSGATQLDSGAGELSDGAEKLDDGAKELHDGAKKLRDGMKEYQEDGIGKLLDIYEDHIPVLLDRLEALKALGEDYVNYSGMTDGTEGSVRFIIRTEG